MRRKIPQAREIRKLSKDKTNNPYLSLTSVTGTYEYVTLDYLGRIGVPTNGLKDPVLIRLLPNDQFIIIPHGKEVTYSPGAEVLGQQDTRA